MFSCDAQQQTCKNNFSPTRCFWSFSVDKISSFVADFLLLNSYNGVGTFSGFKRRTSYSLDALKWKDILIIRLQMLWKCLRQQVVLAFMERKQISGHFKKTLNWSWGVAIAIFLFWSSIRQLYRNKKWFVRCSWIQWTLTLVLRAFQFSDNININTDQRRDCLHCR